MRRLVVGTLGGLSEKLPPVGDDGDRLTRDDGQAELPPAAHGPPGVSY